MNSDPFWREGISVVVLVRAANARDAVAIISEKLGPEFKVESMASYENQRRAERARRPESKKCPTI